MEPTISAEATRHWAEWRTGVYDDEDGCGCVVVCWGHGDQRLSPQEFDHDEY